MFFKIMMLPFTAQGAKKREHALVFCVAMPSWYLSIFLGVYGSLWVSMGSYNYQRVSMVVFPKIFKHRRIQFLIISDKSSITRGVLDKVGEGFAGVRGDFCGRGVCGEGVLEGCKGFSNVLECSGSFLGCRGVGVRIPRIFLMKIILGIEMRRTPSKVAGFLPLVTPARGVTS